MRDRQSSSTKQRVWIGELGEAESVYVFRHSLVEVALSLTTNITRCYATI